MTALARDEDDRRHAARAEIATVIVVEDSPTTRLILRRMLERASYRVLEAPDGREALAVCEADPPDLMLLDLDMPEMDGTELIGHLRGHRALAELPVIFLSARAKAQDVVAALRLGARDYVRKPCAAVELLARVGAALDRESEVRNLRALAETAEQLSLADSLTGVANRRRFERRREELMRAESPSVGVGLVVLDVDHFKAVNDREGHLAGDAVLRILARRLQAVLGPEDLLVRWGGEEFLVLAPSLDRAGARALAEQLHTTVGEAPFALAGHEPLAITSSVGWAAGSLEELDRLLPLADEALYDAKRAGRDRVAAAHDRG